MSRRAALIPALILAGAAMAAVPGAARAQTPEADAKAVTRPLDQMISLIRYGRFPQASAHLDHRAMSEVIMADAWAGMSEEQRAEFTSGFAYLMENLSFPKVKDSFEYLDAIFYEAPSIEGQRAKVRSTIVIDHPTKGEEEIVLDYLMVRSPEGAWRVLDVTLEDESTLRGIREDQIEDLLDEGGVDLVLKRLREKVDEVRKERAAEGAAAPKAGD